MEHKRYGGNEELYRANAKDEDPTLNVIMEGDYRGRHFVIGAHCTGNPNAYLEAKDEDTISYESQNYENYDGGLNRVNGGSTYFGKAYWNKEDKRMYVGWDYGHSYDYNARHPNLGGRKWDLIDILMEIACAEDEIENLNANDPDYFERIICGKNRTEA